MHIVEYRIPLPLSVEEYRIAQLYMIQKKSRQESSSASSRVEILENRPYTDGPGGDGQYTKKVYHIGSHLPSWIRSILPKTALLVEEEAWNAYPYCRTKFTCPFMERFMLDVETYYQADSGQKQNIFKLTGSESRREIDVIDIVKDQLSSSDYTASEDPRLFTSEKTGRGPLSENWIKETEQSGSSIMCAYKLCRVEFKYWGMQTRIERFIHDVALRKTMLRAHRQAWAWQDEWFGLEMEDIRRLERETQLALQGGWKEEGGRPQPASTKRPVTVAQPTSSDKRGQSPSPVTSADSTPKETQLQVLERNKLLTVDEPSSQSSSRKSSTAESHASLHNSADDEQSPIASRRQSTRSNVCAASQPRGVREILIRTQSFSKQSSPSGQPIDEGKIHHVLGSTFSGIVASSDTDSDEDEFYDALESMSEKEGYLDSSNDQLKVPSLMHCSSNEMLDVVEPQPCSSELSSSPGGGNYSRPLSTLSYSDFSSGDEGGSGVGESSLNSSRTHFDESIKPITLQTSKELPLSRQSFQLPTNTEPQCRTDVLILVFHGGHPLDNIHDAKSQDLDVQLFHRTLSSITQSHYGQSRNRVVCRLVSCPPICASAFSMLSLLDPSSAPGADIDSWDTPEGRFFTSPGSSALPIAGLPLMATASASYHDSVAMTVKRANIAYLEFLQSEEGRGFHGEVCVVGDCLGSLLAYDALCLSSEQDTAATPAGSPVVDESPTGLRPQHNSGRSLRGVNGSPSPGFKFSVNFFFALGSPLGLVLASRKLQDPSTDIVADSPACGNLFNLFYTSSPFAARLEPLLHRPFANVPPVSAPRHRQFPLGDGQSHTLAACIMAHPEFHTNRPHSSDVPMLQRSISCRSNSFSASDFLGITNEGLPAWWGDKRLDYVLYCPEAVEAFPQASLPHLLHGSFWESHDVASFIARQVFQPPSNHVYVSAALDMQPFVPRDAREKWLRRRTAIKVKGLTANHRASDVAVNVGDDIILSGKFMYGPLDLYSLVGEKVDLFMVTNPPSGPWVKIDTQLTERQGKVTFRLSAGSGHDFREGLYPVKMLVRGDHTQADSYLAVLPQRTEAIVFSVDGSFAASISLTGTDPKVHPGAVDVVRYWQELGYLIIYITGRPDMQKSRVVSWLAQHNFPHGLIFFNDGLSTEPLNHKTAVLNSLIKETKLTIHGAYGSHKDKAVYREVGIDKSMIQIVGKRSFRSSRKQLNSNTNYISDGYALHLEEISSQPRESANPRPLLRKQCFCLPAQRKQSMRHRSNKSRPGAAESILQGIPSVHLDSPRISRTDSALGTRKVSSTSVRLTDGGTVTTSPRRRSNSNPLLTSVLSHRGMRWQGSPTRSASNTPQQRRAASAVSTDV